MLRDCFLQLKAFENEDSEDQDETDGKSIQEKLKSMMDVSAVCIYLNKSCPDSEVIYTCPHFVSLSQQIMS